MFGFLTSLLSGGLIGSVEKVATEFIETNTEKAEAQTLLIKTLDPNGKMRRDLSKFACLAYGFYLMVTTILVFMVAFGWGDSAGAEMAAGLMKDLFLPITTAWGGIVGASFGVNGMNSFKGK